MVYGFCRDRKDVLTCITSQHWKCSKSLTLLSGLICRFSHVWFVCTLKLACPSLFLIEKTSNILISGTVSSTTGKYLYSTTVLFPTYKPRGSLSFVFFFFLFPHAWVVQSIFLTTFFSQGISAVNAKLIIQFTLLGADSVTFLAVP